MSDESFDALELELRRLPGVSFVGFDERDGGVVVQLLAAGVADAEDLRERAGHLSRAHLDAPAIIEIDTGPGRMPAAGERVELLAVLPSPDGREIEVHLAYAGMRTIGRGAINGGPSEAAGATLDALRGMRLTVPFTVQSAASGLAGAPGDAVAVVLASDSPGNNRFGMAAGGTVHEAAARATLHALNRFLGLAHPGPVTAPAATA